MKVKKYFGIDNKARLYKTIQITTKQILFSDLIFIVVSPFCIYCFLVMRKLFIEKSVFCYWISWSKLTVTAIFFSKSAILNSKFVSIYSSLCLNLSLLAPIYHAGKINSSTYKLLTPLRFLFADSFQAEYFIRKYNKDWNFIGALKFFEAKK